MKNATINASHIIVLYFELKKFEVLPTFDSCSLLATMEAISSSALVTPSLNKTSLAATKFFLIEISQRGLSGILKTITVYINAGIVITPNIQRQSFSPPIPLKK